MTINKLECNVYISSDGEIQFHYPDTSLVFSISGGNVYAKDRDAMTVDVFADGQFKDTLNGYFDSHDIEQFSLDFGGRGLVLCSYTDTHSINIDDLIA